ncbi:MAG: VCBS repeat-containing protein [Verrucomicrobiota bacterium]
MTRHSFRPFSLSLLAFALGISTVSGLVNPTLQPADLFDRYENVVLLKIIAVDSENATATLEVTGLAKGGLTAKQVVLTATGDAATDAFRTLAGAGVAVVAYAGAKGRAGADSVLFYLGGEGRWQKGTVTAPGGANTPARWNWTVDLDNEMYGTFNGHPARLAELMVDRANNRAFFPARPFDQFKDDQLVGTLDKPVRGVALYDLNGDGRLDIYAASEAGGRLYLQQENLTFTDVTHQSGLDGIRGCSVSVADANLDGRPDLLIDGKLYLQDAKRVFNPSADLPAGANQNVKMAAFTDLNRDGYPDIVISKINGGLHAYLNPGTKPGPYTDATTALGLDTPACGVGLTGFFIPGDWDNSGKTALFYSVKGGLLLVPDPQGKFGPLASKIRYDFSSLGEDAALTGAGCFAPTWMPDSSDYVFAHDGGINILSRVDGKPFDGGQFGNEIIVSTRECLAAAAEDLNADGRVDIYAISRQAGTPNGYYVNRGHGSFIASLRYNAKAIPGPAHQQGALGVAIGDVNGDGANDILLGGTDGKLTLLVNDTLSLREPKESSTAQEKVLEQTGIVSVRVVGPRGVIGARVTLQDKAGHTVSVRDIGCNVATGCAGPDTLNLAVRQPGEYKLTVRYSDGFSCAKSITIKPRVRASVSLTREGNP